MGTLVEKLGDGAEKGGKLRKSGKIRRLDPAGKARGVFGFTVKVPLASDSS